MDTFINFLAALGAIALAIIAIFQDPIRKKIMSPKLVISMTMEPPDCHKAKLTYQHSVPINVFPRKPINSIIPPHTIQTAEADVYYFRIRVNNYGKAKAKNVEVFASELSKLKADGTYKTRGSFLPMNLRWAHMDSMFFPSINPGTYKHCDIFHIVDPNARKDVPGEDKSWSNISKESNILSFDTIVKPLTLNYLVPEGKYQLKIIIAAENSDPIKETLEINNTGEWFDNETKMLYEGIAIKIHSHS